MNSQERPRILCVDDEPSVLEGLGRILRRHYHIECASGASTAIEHVEKNGPFAVIMSDLRMPGTDGVTLLGQVRSIAPDTVRILLTGQADLDDAIHAVNHGNIFRLLLKPCPTELLLKALAASIEQHSLITAERVLLQETLHGTIKCLMEVLGAANPIAFGRATRVQRIVSDLGKQAGITNCWPAEVAAMWSQIGYISIPQQTLDKMQKGVPLNSSEQQMLERVPALAEQLVANIPRLDEVRSILRYYKKNFDGTGQPTDGVATETIPWGARALRVALDLDALESEEHPISQPMDVLYGRAGYYDPAILEALACIREKPAQKNAVKELGLRELKVGMVFAEDMKSPAGLLLVSRGQEVTPGLLERLSNFSGQFGPNRRVRVILGEVREPVLMGRA
jgi:response regulator RpfG family c-di-GMP phosphodiesterase